MVTICILGLDQFVVGHYSKDHTKALASIFAVPEEAINFYAPNSMVFHAGAEQTSWNTIVVVRAPGQLEGCEDKAAEYILETLSQFSIHVELEFEYFEPGRHHERINHDYPRYLSEENIKEADVSIDYGEEEHEQCHHDHDEDGEDPSLPNPADRADLDYNDPNQIFLGDAFASFEEEVAKKKGGAK